MAEPVTATLRRALRLIAERQPKASMAIATALDGLTLSVTIASEPGVVLGSVSRSIVEIEEKGPANLRLRTDRASVRALLSGRLTLNRALRSGAVELFGTTADLTRGLSAFEVFVGALLRMDEADDLRRELETET